MNYYKRHIGDYIRDTSHLSLLEHGVYTRLLDIYYTTENYIPDDRAERLVGARTEEERAAVRTILEEFFDDIGGHWCHTRCDSEIAAAHDKAEKNRDNGGKGGRPPKQEPKCNPEITQSVSTENPDTTLATTPLATTPLASSESAPKGATRLRKSRLPEDWVLPDGWKQSGEEARQRGGLPPADLTAEAERFKAHWLENGKTKQDWRLTWLKWCVSPYVKAPDPGRRDPAAPAQPVRTLPGSNLAVVMAEAFAKRIRENSPVGRGSISDSVGRLLVKHGYVSHEEAQAYGLNTRETSEAA